MLTRSSLQTAVGTIQDPKRHPDDEPVKAEIQ
jgi:hypothetical protein